MTQEEKIKYVNDNLPALLADFVNGEVLVVPKLILKNDLLTWEDKVALAEIFDDKCRTDHAVHEQIHIAISAMAAMLNNKLSGDGHTH